MLVNQLRASASLRSKFVTWNESKQTVENRPALTQLSKRVTETMSSTGRQQAISDAAGKAIHACITNSITQDGTVSPTTSALAKTLIERTLSVLDSKTKVTARTVNEALDQTLTSAINSQLSELGQLIKQKQDLLSYVRASRLAAEASRILYSMVNTRLDGTLNLHRTQLLRVQEVADSCRVLEGQLEMQLGKDRNLAHYINHASSFSDLTYLDMQQKDDVYRAQNQRFDVMDRNNVELARFNIAKALELKNELSDAAAGIIPVEQLSDTSRLMLYFRNYNPAGTDPNYHLAARVAVINRQIDATVKSVVDNLHLEDQLVHAPIRSFRARMLPSYSDVAALPTYQTTSQQPPSYSPQRRPEQGSRSGRPPDYAQAAATGGAAASAPPSQQADLTGQAADYPEES